MCSGAAPLDSASALVSASIIFGTDSSVTRCSYSLTSITGMSSSSAGVTRPYTRVSSTAAAAAWPGADGALHVHVPDARDVRAGPVEGADRSAQVGSEAAQATDLEGRRVGAACPFLRRPVDLDVVDGIPRLVAEEGGEAVEHDRAALVGAHALGLLARSPGRKLTSTPGSPLGGELSYASRTNWYEANASPDEPVLAPERVVVHGEHLDHAALRDALLGPHAPRGQRGLEADAAGEVRRDRDDHLTRRDSGARSPPGSPHRPTSGTSAPVRRAPRVRRAARQAGSAISCDPPTTREWRQRSGSKRLSTLPAPAITQSPPSSENMCAGLVMKPPARKARSMSRACSSSTSRCNHAS